jgi:quinoprotein glucose dehydrogenase
LQAVRFQKKLNKEASRGTITLLVIGTPQRVALLVLLLAWFCGFCRLNAQSPAPVDEGWPTYGGDPGGLRYSKAAQITRENLGQLRPVWVFHTHALDLALKPGILPSFETTPVLSGDTLYLTTPFDVVFALDARTGVERWHFDPKLASLSPGGLVTSRGVALWPLGAAPETPAPLCSQRVFLGTLDARLLALDASTGQLCTEFGDRGGVDLRVGVHYQNIGFYGLTSPPTVVGNVVVVGSSVGDNQQVDIESGLVRGYDAASGKLLWIWEPLPWAQRQKLRTGGGNAWGVISADPKLGLVYLPTGSAAPDLYGGLRPGDDRDANSIVALDATSGKKVWSFQVVHHDVLDYDIPSEPVLFTWRGTTPAVAVTTKMGMIFIFDRRTGQPLVPIEERPVPQSDVSGEQTSPTQPFSNVPPLSPLVLDTDQSPAYQRPEEDVEACRKQLAELRYDGIFTPASLKGSINFPGPSGGVNWGGATIDPATGILYANTNRLASVVRLIPRNSFQYRWHQIQGYLFAKKLWLALFLLVFVICCIGRRRLNPGWAPVVVLVAGGCFIIGRMIYNRLTPPPPYPTVDHFAAELSPQRKSPYALERYPLVDSHGFNCVAPPWGAITAVNLNTLTKVWEKPLGTMVPGQQTGIRNYGGPIVTASGLVITAGSEDRWLRILDAATGEELKRLSLPVPGVSTPMTYTLDGRQYIVVAAGGHGDGVVPLGDSLIAFAVK